MRSPAKSVDTYLKTLPAGHREMLAVVRRIILENLAEGYKEGMQYGMITYYIPLARYSKTYNGQPLSYISLASQRNYMALYLMYVYGEGEAAFRRAYRKTGKQLDMGKSCVRFRHIDDLPLELIAKTVAKYTPEAFIALYERGSM